MNSRDYEAALLHLKVEDAKDRSNKDKTPLKDAYTAISNEYDKLYYKKPSLLDTKVKLAAVGTVCALLSDPWLMNTSGLLILGVLIWRIIELEKYSTNRSVLLQRLDKLAKGVSLMPRKITASELERIIGRAVSEPIKYTETTDLLPIERALSLKVKREDGRAAGLSIGCHANKRPDIASMARLIYKHYTDTVFEATIKVNLKDYFPDKNPRQTTGLPDIGLFTVQARKAGREFFSLKYENEAVKIQVYDNQASELVHELLTQFLGRQPDTMDFMQAYLKGKSTGKISAKPIHEHPRIKVTEGFPRHLENLMLKAWEERNPEYGHVMFAADNAIYRILTIDYNKPGVLMQAFCQSKPTGNLFDISCGLARKGYKIQSYSARNKYNEFYNDLADRLDTVRNYSHASFSSGTDSVEINLKDPTTSFEQITRDFTEADGVRVLYSPEKQLSNMILDNSAITVTAESRPEKAIRHASEILRLLVT
ncbi:MAG: hypothetical protein ABIF10_02105 [Candidatus Woesearchaeota archaeon]